MLVDDPYCNCCLMNSFGTKTILLNIFPDAAAHACNKSRDETVAFWPWLRWTWSCNSKDFMDSYAPKYNADAGMAPTAAGTTPRYQVDWDEEKAAHTLLNVSGLACRNVLAESIGYKRVVPTAPAMPPDKPTRTWYHHHAWEKGAARRGT